MWAPSRSARSDASSCECCEEYLLGMETPYTFSPPIASAAMAATSAESMPPDMPNVTDRKPFLRT